MKYTYTYFYNPDEIVQIGKNLYCVNQQVADTIIKAKKGNLHLRELGFEFS